MEAEFKGRINWVLQERVGSGLQNEAVSIWSEGKGEKCGLDAYLKQW